MTIRKTLRRSLIVAAALPGLVVLAVLAIWLYAQSDFGLRHAARLFSTLLSDDEQRIEIGRLNHIGFWRVDAASLAASDVAGVWVEIDHLRLDWSWADIIDLSLRPRVLAVDTMRLNRLPDTGTTAASEPVSLPLLPAARISIERLELVPNVLGEPMVARIDGAEVVTEAGDLELTANIERIDGADSLLALRATYRPASETVAIRGELSEGPDGVLGHMLDIPDAPAYRAVFDGEGPRTNWRGRFEMAAGGRALGDGDVTLAFEDAVTVAFDGYVHASPRFGEALERAIGDRASLTLDVAWDRGDQVTISRAELRAGAFDLEASGLIALGAETFDGRAKVRTGNVTALPGLANEGIEGAGEVTFVMASPISQPAGDLEIKLADVRRGAYGARSAMARGHLETLTPLSDSKLTFRLSLDGTIEGPKGMPESVEPAIGDRIDWSFDGRYRTADNVIALESFDVRSAHVRATGKGSLVPSYHEARAMLSYSIDDLAALKALANAPVEGRLDGTADIVVDLSDGAIGAKLIAQGENFSLGLAKADALLGPTPALDAHIDIGPDGAIRFAALELDGRVGSLRGEGVYLEAMDQVKAALQLDIPVLAALSDVVGTPLRGATTIAATFEGTFDALAATGTLTASGIEAEGATIERLNASFSAVDLFGRPKGEFRSRFVAKGIETKLDANLALAKSDTLRVARLKAAAPNALLTGDLSIGLNDGLISGKAQARLAALDNWAGLFDLDMTGSATLDAELDVKGGRQSAAIDLSGRVIALSLPDGRRLHARSMSTQARIEDVWGTPRGDATVKLSDAESDRVSLNSLTLTASGTQTALQTTLRAEGAAARAFRLDASAEVATGPQDTIVRIDRLEGRYGALPVRMRDKATVRLADGGGVLDRLRLAVGKGTIDLAGGLKGERVDAIAQARGIPLDLVRAFVPGLEFDGVARLDAAISGTAVNPAVQTTLEITNLQPRLPDAPPGTLSVQGKYVDGRIVAELALSGLGKAPVVASFAMPMRLSVSPITLEIDNTAPIEGQAEGNVDLGLIAPLLPLDEDRLEGQIRIEASLAGTLARPEASGRATLTNGRYENFMTAAALKNIDFEIVGDGDTIQLRSLTAQGDDGGQVSGSGQVRLDIDQDFPLELEFDFSELWVARLDAVSSRASGKLALSGKLEAMALSGAIDIGPTEIRIPERLPASVTTLDVIEVNRPGEPEAASAEPGAGATTHRTPPTPMTLDIALKAPGRLFVRGRGLDSEWAGAINLRGDIDSPRFDGAFRVVRGNFDLLGKRFALREGTISLDEAAPLDPEINVLAEAISKETTAQARLQGSLKSPELTLTSVPELPPDEVLSRILFNKGVGQLSAVEAVQLAESAATLSGQGGTSGVLDRLRRTAGFDTLSIDAADKGASVTAGKYLEEDVLLKVEQGSQAGSSRVGVEIEVTPNLSVETKTGASGESEVGVNWKWDY